MLYEVITIDIFLERFNRTYGKDVKGFSTEALQVMMHYSYNFV